MRKQILTLVLLAVSVSGFSQTKFGIQGGVIASQVNIDDTSKFVMALHADKKRKIGFKGGVFAEVPVSEQLYFNPAVNFVYKGGTYNSVFFGDKLRYDYITSYIEVPLNLVLKAKASGGIYGGAGPAVGLGIGGKRKYRNEKKDGTIDAGSNTIKFDGKTWQEAGIEDYHLKALEIGLNSFVGYELQNGLRFELQYRPNFSNLSTTKDISSYKNDYFGLVIGCAL